MFLELFKGEIFTLTIQIKFSNLFSTFIEPTSSTNVQKIFKNIFRIFKEQASHDQMGDRKKHGCQ